MYRRAPDITGRGAPSRQGWLCFHSERSGNRAAVPHMKYRNSTRLDREEHAMLSIYELPDLLRVVFIFRSNRTPGRHRTEPSQRIEESRKPSLRS